MTRKCDIMRAAAACDAWPPAFAWALCESSANMPSTAGANSAKTPAVKSTRSRPQVITVSGFLAISWKPDPTAEPIEMSAIEPALHSPPLEYLNSTRAHHFRRPAPEGRRAAHVRGRHPHHRRGPGGVGGGLAGRGGRG